MTYSSFVPWYAARTIRSIYWSQLTILCLVCILVAIFERICVRLTSTCHWKANHVRANQELGGRGAIAPAPPPPPPPCPPGQSLKLQKHIRIDHRRSALRCNEVLSGCDVFVHLLVGETSSVGLLVGETSSVGLLVGETSSVGLLVGETSSVGLLVS